MSEPAKRSRLNKLFKSFTYAFDGLKVIWRQEVNFRIHLVLGGLALLLGLVLRISRVELICLVIMIALVLFAELVNSSLERLADMVQAENDERIKVLKDISAAAVLLLAIAALLVGVFIFLPPILKLF